MRNWNRNERANAAIQLFVFTVPMRNWNKFSILFPSIFTNSFYSTYEELKLLHFEYNNQHILLFLQYLWGIETEKVWLWALRASESFYSTYEELKQTFGLPTIFCSIGFYSTYEELKQELQRQDFVGTFGFYSTYEELKLKLFCKVTSHTTQFFQYLWGIETCYIF